jgi:cytochrome c5
MKQKDIGLLVSICVLAFLAVFSEKKIEVTHGYYVTQAELKMGGEVFRRICRRCHGRESRSGAPPMDNPKAWEERLPRGMETLIDHALDCPGGKGRTPPEGGQPPLSRQEAEAAVAYMIRQIQ